MKHLHIALFVVISVVLASVLSDGAARTEQGDTTSSAVSLKGQLLVAAPSLRDPNFSETVIFMIDHDQDGAFGLIINRRIGVGPLDKFLQGFGIESSARLGDVAIHAGGQIGRAHV